MRHRGKSIVFFITFVSAFSILVISVVFAVKMGTMDIKTSEIVSVIQYKILGIGDAKLYDAGPVPDIVWHIRLPRLILAICTGSGLAVCGAVMQAIVKNPLADPYVLGVSSGASLGATLAILLGVGSFFGQNFVGLMACIGAFLVGMLVLFVSNIGGRSSSVKLLLAGMALSAVCSAFSSLVVYLTNDREGMASITFWLMGSMAGAKWDSLIIIVPSVLACILYFWTQSRTLNLMLFGDDVAVTLGTDLRKYRNFYLFVCSLLVGFAVYAAGMIGFIGLLVPHIVRMLFGTNHKYLIPLAAILGALLLLWADVLCRIILPRTELPIGILLSVIGAPFFVYLLISRSYGFGGGS